VKQNQSEMPQSSPPVIAEGLYSFQIGGSERIGAEVAIGFAKRGYRVLCFAFYDSEGPIKDTLVKAGIECPDLNYLSRKRFTRRFTYQVAFARFLKRENVQALHVQHATALILSGIAARLCGVQRIVMTEHALHQFKADPSYRRAAARYCRLAHEVTVVHPSLIDFFRTEIRVPAHKLHYVPNGVHIAKADSQIRTLRHVHGVADTQFLLVFAGRLHPVKDVSTLLNAVARLTANIRARICVWIVGDGEERASLETQREALGLNSVVSFLGARTDVQEILNEADGFIMTSITEGLPMALLEAMAARVPCIATQVGGIPELLGNGAGLLAQARDPAGIAECIAQLVCDTELRARLIESAVAKVAQHNDIEKVVTQYLSLLGLPERWLPGIG
jgi:glycosyltransferase involved in cell wall biosynthesis